MLNKNIETILGCDAEYEDAGIVLFGAPFDSTTSYRPGTRFGSSAIRHESFGMETYSPYQDKDMTDYAFFDSGDIELCIGSSQLALEAIEERARTILADGKLPFMLGGEHLVTLGAFRAAAEKYPDIHIIHFDAHADLREDYLDVKLSHACVIRRCWEIVGDGKMTPELKQTAFLLKLQEHVVFYGEQKNPYRFMVNADLLLITSYHEAAPMVVDEAHALGIPVLTVETTSSREMVTERAGGWVCANSQQGINEALAEVLGRPGALRKKKNDLAKMQADNTEAYRQFKELIGES